MDCLLHAKKKQAPAASSKGKRPTPPQFIGKAAAHFFESTASALGKRKPLVARSVTSQKVPIKGTPGFPFWARPSQDPGAKGDDGVCTSGGGVIDEGTGFVI